MKLGSIALQGLVGCLIVAAPNALSGTAGGTCKTTVPAGLVAPGTNWTLAASPYCVTGDIQVSLLTIDAGVCVEFQGSYRMDVLTSITVNGTERAPVLFTSPAGMRWRGVQFLNTGPGSSFTHAIFEKTDSSAVVVNNAASPSFDDCVFRDNRKVSGAGGALNLLDVIGDVTISGCEFTGNTAESNGGAIRAKLAPGSTFTCLDSKFAGNVANPGYATGNRVGGALYIEDGDAILMGCEFRGNRSNARCTSSFGCNVTARGGAVYLGSGGVRMFENCSLISNTTDARNNGNCFFGGVSESYGAGLYVGAGTATLSNCVLSCNSTVWTNCGPRDGGGGVYVNGGTVTLDHCTVARNNNATGVRREAGSLSVTNSILYFNNGGGSQVAGTVSVSFSDVQNGGTMNGNLPFAPAFAGTGCDCGDLSIVLGSPAIDMGDPATPGDVAFPPSWGTSLPDMGANGGPLAANWAKGLTSTPASPAQLSVSAGGTQTFHIDAGASHGGLPYVVMGSATGFAPGFQFGGLCFPLDLDNYFNKTISNPTKARLMTSIGFLDTSGKATASLTVPAGFNRLIGQRIYYAYVVVDPSNFTVPLFVSNPVATLLVP